MELILSTGKYFLANEKITAFWAVIFRHSIWWQYAESLLNSDKFRATAPLAREKILSKKKRQLGSF